MPGKRTSPGHSSPRPAGRKARKQPKARDHRKKKIPTGFVTTESLEILEFLGDTSPYLHLTPGKAVLHPRKIVTPLLYRELLAAVKKAATESVAGKSDVSLLLGTQHKKINIEVTQFKNRSIGETCYRILLEEVIPPRKSPETKHKPKAKETKEADVARLTQELAATKESFGVILAEQEREHETTLKQLTESKAVAAELEVTRAELEATHAELEAHAEELRAALAEGERREERLQESEGRVRALLEMAAQGILAVERNGRIGLVNRTVEKMFGYRREELLGQPVEMLLPDNLRRAHRRRRRDFFAHPRTRPMGQGLDLFARRKDGGTFPVEISLSHIEPGDEMVAVAFISDITERKRAEAQSRLQAAITANMAEGIALVRVRDGVIVYANDRFNDLFGYESGELEGRPVTVLNAGEQAEAQAASRKILRALNRKGTWRGEVRNVRKDGTILWTRASVSTLEDPEHGTVWVGVQSDITEGKEAETALQRSHEELHSLTARLTAAQEEQYRHLSRELHDIFSQKLIMLGMHVSELERKLSAAGLATGEDFGQIGAQISDLAAQIHGISRRLHPAILDDLGLAAALKNECLAFTREHGIEVVFDPEGRYEAIPSDVALCLYRVARESLNNIQKHSQTGRVHMRLAVAPDEVVLSIEDFGKGFDPDEVRGKGGLGLVSMEERIQVVDGELTIRSSPGDGTTVQVRVPLKKAARRRRKR